MPEMRDINLVDGRFFTETRRSALTSSSPSSGRIWSPPSSRPSNPVAPHHQIKGHEFVVLGAQEKLGSAFGQSQDNGVYIPYTVYTRLYGPGTFHRHLRKARPETGLSVAEALDVSRVALRTRFHARPGSPTALTPLTPDAMLSFIGQMLGMIAVVVVPVTLISLVVGASSS